MNVNVDFDCFVTLTMSMWINTRIALCLLHPECQRPSQCFTTSAFNSRLKLVHITAHSTVQQCSLRWIATVLVISVVMAAKQTKMLMLRLPWNDHTIYTNFGINSLKLHPITEYICCGFKLAKNSNRTQAIYIEALEMFPTSKKLVFSFLFLSHRNNNSPKHIILSQIQVVSNQLCGFVVLFWHYGRKTNPLIKHELYLLYTRNKFCRTIDVMAIWYTILWW